MDYKKIHEAILKREKLTIILSETGWHHLHKNIVHNNYLLLVN